MRFEAREEVVEVRRDGGMGQARAREKMRVVESRAARTRRRVRRESSSGGSVAVPGAAAAAGFWGVSGDCGCGSAWSVPF